MGDVSANRDVRVGCFPSQGNPLSWAVCVCPALCWVILLLPFPWAEEYWAIRICHLQPQAAKLFLHNLNWQLQLEAKGQQGRTKTKRERDNPTTRSASVSSFLEELP